VLVVLIQDFRRQRRALDAGDFSECFRPFSAIYVPVPVAEAARDKQYCVFLTRGAYVAYSGVPVSIHQR
jgi:hypothetical protein